MPSAVSRAAHVVEPRAPFPLDALPEWLGEYVAAVAASVQVPVDMPAAVALGALATAGARVADVHLHAGHIEPLNLFVAIVAPPGSKKSPVLSAFQKPIGVYEAELKRDAEPELRRARVERTRLEKELEAAKKRGQWDHYAALQEELDELERGALVEPRLTTADVTAQKLASLLAAHRCFAVWSGEPTIFQTMLGRWSSGAAELEVFLSGHAGEPLKVDRQGRASENVENPRLTLTIGAQPDAMRRLSNSEASGRGLLARFIWVVPPDMRGQGSIANARPIPEENRESFAAGLRRVLTMPPRSTPMELTADAGRRWVEFSDAFESRLAPGGDMRELVGWGEKFRGGVVGRIAGLLHLAGGNATGSVSRETLEAAIAIGRWAEGQALDAFTMMELRPEVRAAKAILEMARRFEWSKVTQREAHQKLRDRRGYEQVDVVIAGLELLVERGALVREPHTARAGRPSPTFSVNASVHEGSFQL